MSTAIQRRQHRKYTPEQKAEVLAVFQANEGNLARTAILVKIPRKTIERWVAGQASDREDPEKAAALRQDKRKELANQFRDLAKKMLGVLATKIESMSGRDLALAAAIATDKWRLLEGEPTSISTTLKEQKEQEDRMALFRKHFGQAQEMMPDLLAGRVDRLRERYSRLPGRAVNDGPPDRTLLPSDLEAAAKILDGVRPRTVEPLPELPDAPEVGAAKPKSLPEHATVTILRAKVEKKPRVIYVNGIPPGSRR